MDDFEKQQLIQLNEIEKIKKTIAGYDKMFNSALQDQISAYKSCCDNKGTDCSSNDATRINFSIMKNKSGKLLKKLPEVAAELLKSKMDAFNKNRKLLKTEYDNAIANAKVKDISKNILNDFQRSAEPLREDKKKNMILNYFHLAYFVFAIFLIIFLFKKQFKYNGAYLFGIFILSFIIIVFLNIVFNIPCVGLGCF
jgi:hypothetical protein